MALKYVLSLDKEHNPGNSRRQSREKKRHGVGYR